jgi:lysozyme
MQGIDVSRFQGKINWQRVADAGIEFAFVQASRGSGSDCAVAPTRCGPDEFYERNYRRARKVGIPIGAYHRAFVGGDEDRGVKRDARIEARLFLRLVGELRGRDLLPALDVETPFAGLTQRELRIWVRTWLARVEKELGVKPFIYTNHSSWQATGDTTMFARAGHPLWVANFDVRAPKVPAANWNGQGWAIWQYTSSGRVGGISGNVDRNALRIPLEAISVKRAHQP